MLVRQSAARAWRGAAGRRLASLVAERRDARVVTSRRDDVVVPQVTLPELVWKDMHQWRDRPAIVCGLTGRAYSYAQLRAACARLAAALRDAGLRPGQVVCVALANAPEFPLALFGALEAGLVVSTVNPASLPREMSAQLVDAAPRAIFCSEENQAAVGEAVRLSARPGLPDPLVVVVPTVREPDTLLPGALLLRRLLDSVDPELGQPEPTAWPVDKVAVIPYSSGTTGMPKGVCLSHSNLVANCAQVRATTAFQRMRVGEVVPAVLPFYHIYGLNSVLSSMLRAGAQLVTLPHFTQSTFVRMLDAHAATMLFLVPPLVLWMAQSERVTHAHLERVWLVCSGAAPLGASDVDRFMLKAPPSLQFIQGYGLTETSPCVFSLEPGSPKLASVGGPLPNVSAKVVAADGTSLGPGQVGEVCCRGPQNMLGYHNNPEATAEMVDSEGWLHTGDLGYYDEDDDFFIVDRLKELIKVKGMQVAPAELEAVLRSHPDVEDAAVIGIPDERCGEVPLAFVVAKRRGKGAELDEARLAETLQAFVAESLSAHKHLSGGVRFIEAVPKSPAGKILRKELRASLQS